MKKTFKKALALAFIPLLLLTACSQPQTTTTTTSQASSTQTATPASMMAAIEDRGLPISNQQALDENALAKLASQVGGDLTSAATFTNDTGVKFVLVITKSSADATAVRSYYAGQNWHVTSDPSRRIVFAAERTLKQSWFDKYKVPVLRS
ncbi:hypothetical protein [Lacticaseibacillus mingshuiensis]|uniref:Lipoprotein n=1 Tax=Lacticaseibacillus mingshuiensis TaxID=2799574 RepID=A0ABW4CL76_9LACO|nr:hypothetical protein [Lacticaseibacillus mingshuiensis]